MEGLPGCHQLENQPGIETGSPGNTKSTQEEDRWIDHSRADRGRRDRRRHLHSPAEPLQTGPLHHPAGNANAFTLHHHHAYHHAHNRRRTTAGHRPERHLYPHTRFTPPPRTTAPRRTPPPSKPTRCKDWGRAAEFLKQVIQEEPGAADLHYLLGEIYRQQGNTKEAAAAYDAAIKANAAFAPAYLGKGRLALITNPTKADAALVFFVKAFEMDPNLHEAMLELANIYLVKGEPENALLWLDRYSQAVPGSALVEFYRARVHLLLGDPAAALTAVEKSRTMDISYMPVYKLWGQILQINGRYEDSAVPLLTYLKSVPLDSEAQLLVANAYFHLEEFDKALETINQVISVNNKVENAYLLRGDIYMVQGKPDDADKNYITALQLNYRSFGGFIGKARVLLSESFAGAAYNYIERCHGCCRHPAGRGDCALLACGCAGWS